MIVEISKKHKTEEPILSEMKSGSGAALDELWKSSWINDSVMKKDAKALEDLKEISESIRRESDMVIVIAEETAERGLKAVLESLPAEDENAPETVIWRNTLSAWSFSKMLEKIEGKRLTLIAIASEPETIELRAAYAIFKNRITGTSKNAGSHAIVAFTGERSTVIRNDAGENGYTRIELPEDHDMRFMGNSNALMLLLMIKGVDTGAYLEGFSETVASPEWDRDASIFAFEQTHAAEGTRFLTWQDELRAIAEWAKEVLGTGEEMKGEAFDVILSTEEGMQDVMTPSFEGCDPDGSLFLLSKSEENKYVEESKIAFRIGIPRADERSIGALIAFVQMSAGISDSIRQIYKK